MSQPAALNAGTHVVADKPLCISLDELDEIERAARANGRIVGCMLDMRDLAVYLGLRQQIQEGRIGEVHAISFDGLGLTGMLRGNVLTSSEPGRPASASGEFSIQDGHYRAYGQDLE